MGISEGTPEQTTIAALRRILAEHKTEILTQPERLMGVLLDYLPRTEVNLLVSAVRAGIPQQIVGARSDTPEEVLLAALRNRMTRDQGFSTGSAEWVVQAWLMAIRPETMQTKSNAPYPQQASSRTTTDTNLTNTNRVKANRRMLAVVAVLIGLGILGMVAYRMMTEPPFEFREMAFYDVTTPETSSRELHNYNSWCDYPEMKCATVTAFRVTAPYVQAQLQVSFSSSRSAEIPVHCTASNPESPIAATADVVGQLPDPMYPKLRQTVWLLPFKAPQTGWTPGTYQVVCTMKKGSVNASFKVER